MQFYTQKWTEYPRSRETYDVLLSFGRLQELVGAHRGGILVWSRCKVVSCPFPQLQLNLALRAMVTLCWPLLVCCRTAYILMTNIKVFNKSLAGKLCHRSVRDHDLIFPAVIWPIQHYAFDIIMEQIAWFCFVFLQLNHFFARSQNLCVCVWIYVCSAGLIHGTSWNSAFDQFRLI